MKSSVCVEGQGEGLERAAARFVHPGNDEQRHHTDEKEKVSDKDGDDLTSLSFPCKAKIKGT